MASSGSPWPVFGQATPASSSSPPGRTPASTRSILCCCSKIQFLEVMLVVSAIAHILAISVGSSIIHYGKSEDIQFRGRVIDATATGSELLVVGVTGAVVNILGVIGLWRKQRLLLIPVILFMTITLLLDMVTTVAFFTNNLGQGKIKETNILVPPESKDVDISHLVAPFKHSQDHSFALLFPFFLVKLVVSIIIYRSLLDVYRRDPNMRVTRSPLRNLTKSQEKAKQSAETVEDSPPMDKYKRLPFIP